MDQEFNADHDSEVTSADGSGTNDNNSKYVESRKKLPVISDNRPELKTIIEEIIEIQNDANTELEEFSTPRALFTHPHDLNPMQLTGAETTPTKIPRDNVVTPPLLTQTSPPKSPQVDALEDLFSPLPFTRTDANSSAHLAIKSDLDGICLTGADGELFGVYHDWVHQNSNTHLDGEIDEDGK